MWRTCILFALCVLPTLLYADTLATDIKNGEINAETNFTTIENSIKINEEEFEQVVEQVKQKYTDFDWGKFDALEPRTKRMVIKNYLARLAFEEVKENYMKDLRARAKDGISSETSDWETYYFNESDTKYRKLYVTEKDLAEKAKVSNKCDGCSWVYFKQKDVKKLDELIKQETANAPVDMYCEKYCAIPKQVYEEDDFLAGLKNSLERDKQINDKYLYEMKKHGASKKEIEEERKKIADEIHRKKEEYANWKKIEKDSRTWRLMPYTTTCEMVSVSCWNVEKIPTNYERFELEIADYDDGITTIDYIYDDIANNTHTEHSAWRECTCEHDINDLHTHIDCNCVVSFFDYIQDFAAVRKWENQERIDIKNGKNQDQTENGGWNHDWASNLSPGGNVVGRTLDLMGEYEKNITKGKIE